MESIIDNLFKKVKKNKNPNRTHFGDYPENRVHQMDLIYLPEDNGFKYALVVVDVGTRKIDAQPLKTKLSSDVVKALKTIYRREILKKPLLIQVDSGKEFRGEFFNYCDDFNIKLKVGKTARHKQQALVESANKKIGILIFRRMTEEEIQTGEVSVQWVDDLKPIVKSINDKIEKKRINDEIKAKKQTNKKPKDDYQCSGDTCYLLSEGDKVRVALDYPRNVYDNKRLMGKFRESDVRWEIKPRIIKQVILQPQQPPLYLVSMIDNENETDHGVAYTKNELQLVNDKEVKAQESAIRPMKKGKQELYYVEKVMDKEKKRNRIFYLIKFKGISAPSWEPKTALIEFIPDLLKEYDETH